MGKFAAYLYLIIFGILILFGSQLIATTPQSQMPGELHGFTALYVICAAVSLLIAYVGMYILILNTPRSYLATKFGFATVVRLGTVLHLVIGFLFAFAVYGGEAGSFGMKFLVFLLLFGPIVGRKLWLVGQRDKTFDNFLEDDQNS